MTLNQTKVFLFYVRITNIVSTFFLIGWMDGWIYTRITVLLYNLKLVDGVPFIRAKNFTQL